jgi:hypothetical protein
MVVLHDGLWGGRHLVCGNRGGRGARMIAHNIVQWARQDSCNCYFIFVTVGTKEGSHHFIPDGSRGGGCSMGREKFHFSISEAQLRRTESGAELGSSTLVAIRNLCPSPLTS